tara:strand:- start:772 stop:1104 length:333 start_codon:yes stop_codon:yes gene_type:complete
MALSKKQLRELKNKLQEKDQNAIANIRKAKGPTQKQVKKTIRAKDFTQKKSVVRWNYKVNDLVRVTYGDGSIGLIISNFEYFSRKVEKNCFFVLIDNTVKQIDGRYIRQL